MSDTFTKPKKAQTLADMVQEFEMAKSREQNAHDDREKWGRDIAARVPEDRQAVIIVNGTGRLMRFENVMGERKLVDITTVAVAE